MEFEYPKVIAICHDDYHARHIGMTNDGFQFFLTTPFVPALDSDGCEFIALFKFSKDGLLVSSQIESLGPRSSLDEADAKAKYDALLNSLGEVTFGDIEIAPFKTEEHGVTFGLIPIDSEYVEDEESMSLEFQPGNYMAFCPPWDGEYDT